MKWTGLNELRDMYLRFFESKGHLRHKSFPLVPQNDNSLLLINAGMAPLKPYFTGQEEPPRRRMTTCQKCIRTGDIENVGITARHGTFFEMLGNFSFGDYFKEDAISWAWEFCTEVLELPVDRLFVSIYEDDDEAYSIWHEKIGLSDDKIFRMGKEDNFWEAGIDGPCGPCSEIYFDRGEEYGCGKPGCTVGCDCDRYMEFWNLVFTQFERHEDGTYTPLAQKNIDTGMGLERLAAMMQGVDSIFDVDTIKAIRDKVCEIAHCEYQSDPKKDVSIRVITDHIRSVTFMASDGVFPSNEGRGYVMRRLIRRAVRHAKLLGIDGLFLSELVKTVVDNSKGEYTELEEKFDYIEKLLTNEEKSFNETIDRGITILNGFVDELKASGKTVLDGKSCFLLSDTYGFPIDLTRELLEEQGLSCDEKEFAKCMEEQKERAREARGGSKYMGADETVFHQIDKSFNTEFTGYNTLTAISEISFIATDNELIEKANEGDTVYIVSPLTPFYAESGGQVGDIGTISTPTGKMLVIDTQKVVAGKFAHTAKIVSGEISVGQKAEFEVDKENRMSITRNHTCAHLLQAALREVLGDHVHQAGQLVTADRLRFDFSHFDAVTPDQLMAVEDIVNQKIMDSIDVDTKEMAINDARKLGAMALFGEKYGEVVRVVSVDDFSIEFCGGTHLKNTSQAGLFKIISESSVAAGVRRIEAVTGYGILKRLNGLNKVMVNACKALKLNDFSALVDKCESMMQNTKDLEKTIQVLNDKLALGEIKELMNQCERVNGVRVIATYMANSNGEVLRKIGDQIKSINEPVAAILFGRASESKGVLYCACTKEAIALGAHAGNILKKVSALTGGKGGGKPDSAMGGVGDIYKIDEALSQANAIVGEFVK
ncbi:MAG: alanine--tRNA ligase [Ruminococcus sp.]|nr:alanine--tRNA ligase [Ruminococcus sp.]